ncbi:MAG TPA: hypothetical protein VK157_09625 [Phycisphaerales bacterium]|nr:hypothetical protein [Phycisphaerales bacterium]
MFLDALTDFCQSAGWMLDRQRRLSTLVHPSILPESADTLAERRAIVVDLDEARAELRHDKAVVLERAVVPPIPMNRIPALEWLHLVRLDVESLSEDLVMPRFTPQTDEACCEILERLKGRMKELRALPDVPSKVVSVQSGTQELSEHSRLVAFQRRVRDLATKQPFIKQRLQQAFDEMVVLRNEYDAKCARYQQRKYQLAREAVKAEPRKNHDAGFKRGWDRVEVQGLCPVKLFNQTKGLAFDEHHRRQGLAFDKLPSREKESVNRCAIAALEWQLEYDAASPEKQERLYAERLQKYRAGSHVFAEYFVWIAPPTDVERPDDPIELANDGLLRFSVPERESIALYWLGAIADDGWAFPLIDRPPADSGNRLIAWEQRVWVHANRGASRFLVDDAHLSADDAEAFMLQLEKIAAAESLGNPIKGSAMTDERLTAEQACKQYVVEANTLRLRSEREVWDVSRTPGGMRKYRREDLDRAGYKPRSTVQPRKVVRKSKNDRE